jgi:uncharacterized membrane protein
MTIGLWVILLLTVIIFAVIFYLQIDNSANKWLDAFLRGFAVAIMFYLAANSIWVWYQIGWIVNNPGFKNITESVEQLQEITTTATDMQKDTMGYITEEIPKLIEDGLVKKFPGLKKFLTDTLDSIPADGIKTD